MYSQPNRALLSLSGQKYRSKQTAAELILISLPAHTSLSHVSFTLSSLSPSVHTRVHLFVFFPNPAVCRKRNFGRNFANSERKGNSNSKNEISMDFDRNFGDFDRKMMSVVIFLLFPRSNEKLLNTNFVQFFEIYNFCFRNFFI